MEQDGLKQFEGQQYMNVETVRKSGAVVKTPVWFLQDGDALYFQTEDDSGKVKRIRNNPQVRVTPCKMDGAVTGNWVSGAASLVDDARAVEIGRKYDKKYGLMKKAFDLAGKMRKRTMVTLAVRLVK
jgi:PPOX class probable F420-dependent enzyme